MVATNMPFLKQLRGIHVVRQVLAGLFFDRSCNSVTECIMKDLEVEWREKWHVAIGQDVAFNSAGGETHDFMKFTIGQDMFLLWRRSVRAKSANSKDDVKLVMSDLPMQAQLKAVSVVRRVLKRP